MKRALAWNDYLPVFKRRKNGRLGLNRAWNIVNYDGKWRLRKTRVARRPRPRTTRVRRIRQRNRRRAHKECVRAIVRTQDFLKPDDEGVISTSTYAVENNHRKALPEYLKLFEEYKVLRLYQKFRVARSAKVENDQSDLDIVHWSCYDADGGNKVFTDVAAFQQNSASRWNIMKPYQVVTSSLKPVFRFDNSGYTGVKLVDNPWRSVDKNSSQPSHNCIQHLWVGPKPDAPGLTPNYQIVRDETIVILFRGLRQGQTYA